MKSLFQSLLHPTSAVDESRADVLEMIHACKDMYVMVLQALHDEHPDHTVERVHEKDRRVNELHAGVRRRSYQHMALKPGDELLPTLQLHEIVGEIERVGDYSKNIAELSEMIPGGVQWGSYEEGMATVKAEIVEMFDLTEHAIDTGDESSGQRVIERYESISRYCDATLAEAIRRDEGEPERVERWLLALVLMLRYSKRVAAHLRNAVLTITNPYQRLGYRP